MMNKGMIMEVKKDYAIALTDEGIMEKITYKQNVEVGQKIFYFDDDIVKKATNKEHRHYNFMKTFGSIAALFLLVFTFFNTMKYEQAYAVVSLDINPSIQIEVDNKLNIIKAEGVNADGKNIDFSDIKDTPLDSGIQKIKDKLVEKKYLDNNREVLVGYAFLQNGDNSDIEKDLQGVIDSTFNTEQVTYLEGDKEAVDKAKTQGISLGRYEASLVVDQETKNNIDKVPVREITASIKDKENDKQWEAQDEKDNNTQDVNTKPEVKNDKPATEKSITNATSDNVESSINSSEVKDNADKLKKNNGVLEVQPDVPAQSNNTNSNSGNVTNPQKDNSISITPNNGAIENNTTSGKIQEDSNNTAKNQETLVNKDTKN